MDSRAAENEIRTAFLDIAEERHADLVVQRAEVFASPMGNDLQLPGILETGSKVRYIRQSVRAQRGQSFHVCSEQNL